MRVRQILGNRDGATLTVSATMPVSDFADSAVRHSVGAAPVIGTDGAVAGVISERDLVRGFQAHGCALCEMTVSELMTHDVVCCTPDHTVSDVVSMMADHGIRHVPVVEGDTLVGFISMGDLIATRIEQLELDNEALREMLMNFETIG